MIITIIGIALILFAIVSIILFYYLESISSEDHEGWLVSFGVSGIIGCGIFLTSLIFILANNTPMAHESARIQYNAQVEELTNTREAISNIIDDYARSVSITQYNTLVRKFKEDIEITQIKLNNPWINWFNNYAYKDFDVNVVNYITTFND